MVFDRKRKPARMTGSLAGSSIFLPPRAPPELPSVRRAASRALPYPRARPSSPAQVMEGVAAPNLGMFPRAGM